MNVVFRCPSCDRTAQQELRPSTSAVACSHCGAQFETPAGAVAEGSVHRCLICPSTELYVRKDFSQRAGVAIVVAGFVLSSIFWYYRMPLWTYGTLFATALIDVALYVSVGNLLQCYRCQAQYRGAAGLDQHEPFNLETHERHRQQAARLKDAQAAAASSRAAG